MLIHRDSACRCCPCLRGRDRGRGRGRGRGRCRGWGWCLEASHLGNRALSTLIPARILSTSLTPSIPLCICASHLKAVCVVWICCCVSGAWLLVASVVICPIEVFERGLPETTCLRGRG